MHINHFIRIFIVGMIVTSCNSAVFASDDIIGDFIKNLTDNTSKPTTTILPDKNITRVISPTTGNETLITVKNNGTITKTLVTPNSTNGGKTYSTFPSGGGSPSEAYLDSSGNWSGDATAIIAGTDAIAAENLLTTITSEMVPGATCMCYKNGETIGDKNKACTGPVTERKYQCTTATGLTGFQSVFAKIIRYVINIVLLLGVLAVTGLGIVWSFAGGDDVKMKSTLKTWAINIVVGLIILFMFRYILMFLAPWIYM